MIVRDPLLLAFVLLSLLGAPTITHAQKVNCAKPKNLSIAAMGECANRELAAADKELKQTFQEVLAQYTPKATQSPMKPELSNSIDSQQMQWNRRMLEVLKSSQEAWLQYRESACRAVRDSYEGGTSAEINVPECKAQLTRERIKFLRTYFLDR